MEQLTKKFDELVNNWMKFDNKYVIASISLVAVMYASFASPKLPSFIAKLYDNVLFKILMMFLLLYVSFKFEPSVALITAVSITIVFMTLNLYLKTNETMAEIVGTKSGIPPYVYSTCGKPQLPVDPTDAIRGEHGELVEPDGGVGVDGPVSGVSDAEMQSLCNFMKKDKNAPKEIVTSAEFSELINTEQACKFAKHQYDFDYPEVKCPKPEDVNGNHPEFPSEAPAQ